MFKLLDYRRVQNHIKLNFRSQNFSKIAKKSTRRYVNILVIFFLQTIKITNNKPNKDFQGQATVGSREI